MSWLKKIGEGVKIASAIVPGYGPLIAALIPGTRDDKIIAQVNDTLGAVGGIVIQAEAFGAALSLTGEDKLKGAIGSAAQIVLQSSLMAGQAPQDPAMFLDGVKDLTSGIAKILNSRKG